MTNAYAGQKVTVTLTNDFAGDSAIQSTSFASTDIFELYTYNKQQQASIEAGF